MRTVFLKWVLLVTCLQGPLASAQAQISVWHALNGQTEAAFNSSVQRFEDNNPSHTVAVSQFSSQEDLYTSLMVAVAGGNAPDVVVGNHTMAPALLEAGIVAPYCIPGECPECESANPPRWCAYASNGLYNDFSSYSGYGGFEASMIPALQLDSNRCVQEDCAECAAPTPTGFARPLYCDYIHRSSNLDILQAGFAVWNDEWEWVFPIGRPAWWSHLAYAVDLSWLEQMGLEMPATIPDAEETQSHASGIHAYDLDGEYCGTVPYRFKIPGWVGGPLPDPWENANIFIVPSEQLAFLSEHRPGLQAAVIEGHRPEIIVTGAFVLSTTQERSAALEFMYELGSDETQLEGALGTTFLPTNNGAFENTFDLVPGLRNSALGGVLAPTYQQ